MAPFLLQSYDGLQKCGRKRLPYPSFVANVLWANRVFSVGTLLTAPSEASGLDKNRHWYFDDKMDHGTWYYDFVTVPEGIDPGLVEQMRLNMENEE